MSDRPARRRPSRGLVLLLLLAGLAYFYFLVLPYQSTAGLLRRALVYDADIDHYSFRLERNLAGATPNILDGAVDGPRATAHLFRRLGETLVDDGLLTSEPTGSYHQDAAGGRIPSQVTVRDLLGELPLTYALEVLQLAEEPSALPDLQEQGEPLRRFTFHVSGEQLDPLRERPLDGALTEGVLLGEVRLDRDYRVVYLHFTVHTAAGTQLAELDARFTYPGPRPL